MTNKKPLISQEILTLAFQRTALNMRIDKTGSIRTSIINAVKIIVPNNSFCIGLDGNTVEMDISRMQVILSNVVKFKDFIRAPFPRMFIENEHFGVLVESMPDGRSRITPVRDGAISSYYSLIDLTQAAVQREGTVKEGSKYAICNQEIRVHGLAGSLEVDAQGEVCFEHAASTFPELVKRFRATARSENLRNALGVMDDGFFYAMFVLTSQTYVAAVIEALLYLNLANIGKHVYKPSKREMPNVPEVLHARYTYHIIDVFKERQDLTSLSQVVDFMRASESLDSTEQALRRAHLVRGHFKRKGGKLYWWNPFVRNRKNIDTAGISDHGYKLPTVSLAGIDLKDVK